MNKALNYWELIKRALKIAWQNKYLWWFGLFAGGGSMAFSSGGSPSFELPSGSSDSFERAASQAVDQINWGLAAGIFSIILGFGLLLLVFALLARPAIIYGVSQESGGKKSGFADSIRGGFKYFWRFVLLWLVKIAFVLVVFGLPAFIVVGIIVGIVSSAAEMPGLSALFGLQFLPVVLLFIAAVFAGIVFSYVLLFAERFVVLRNMHTGEALRTAWKFIKENWKQVLVLVLITILINVVVMIVLVPAVLIVVLALTLPGVALYFASGVALVIYAILAGLAFMLLMLAVSAFLGTFYSSYYTLAFKELTE